MLKKRIVVTGLGAVSSIGMRVDEFWKNLISGVSGVKNIKDLYKTIQPHHLKYFNFLQDSDQKYKTKCIATVSDIERFTSNIQTFKQKYGYTGELKISPTEWKHISLFEKFAVGGACEALIDAHMLENPKLNDESKPYNNERVATCIGNGIGGLDTIDFTTEKVINSSATMTQPINHLMAYGPMYIISTIPNLCASYISMAYNLRGPNYVVNAACASANMSICNAADMIRNGRADIVICGGSERSASRSGITGFDAMNALSRHSGLPQHASRPYHEERDGFVYADGAGILILEELKHALKRKAALKKQGINLKIYCEFLDYGVTSDANHISRPSEEGMKRAMSDAISYSGVMPEDIVHATTHATSTPIGDACEIKCIRDVLDKDNNANFEHCTISAIKSSIGHTLGASAGLQSVALAKSFEDGIAPPILNIDPDQSVDPKAKYAILGNPQTYKFDKTKCAMSNSFGFGGCNVVCIWKGYNNE